MPADRRAVPVSSLGDALDGLTLDSDGRIQQALVIVDLDGAASQHELIRAAAALDRSVAVVVGIASRPTDVALGELGAALDCTLVLDAAADRWQVAVPDLDAALTVIADAVARAPVAAVSLARLLRQVEALPVADGLAAESAVYSMLLAGAEFRGWLSAQPPRTAPRPQEPVLIERDGIELTVTLNHPERHNAFSRWVRDGLVEAFDLVAADDTLTRVVLCGAGQSFCSGGDLSEFGTSTDPAAAHLIRLDRSVAARLERCRDRVTVELHGACIGAGIEIASFAGHVRARRDARIELPELGMGLVPGAGGSVGISRRIGRWRTAYLVLTGESLDPVRAAGWGLVDEVLSD